jgi:hypothetical protein
MLKWIMGTVVVATACVLPSNVQADSIVRYYVTGAFSPVSPGPLGTGEITDVYNSSDLGGSSYITIDRDGSPGGASSFVSTLTFNFGSIFELEIGDDGGTAEFGAFSVSSTDRDWADSFDGIQFTLTVHQLEPDAGAENTGSSLGSFSGTLKKGKFSTVSTLDLVFNPATFSIPETGPGITYNLPSVVEIKNSNFGPTAVVGDVAAHAPLPAPALLGLMLFGGLGGVRGLKAWRRRRA